MAFDLKKLFTHGPERIRPDRVAIRETPIVELGTTAIYVLFAALWIVFADDVRDYLLGERIDSTALHVVKGINFTLVTGLVLYFVLRRSYHNRRLAEEALRLSHERFESVALATTDAIWDWNLENNVLWWSDGVQKLFGYGPEEVGTNFEWWLNKMHPDDRDRVVEHVRKVANSGGQGWHTHYRILRKDNTYAVVMARGCVIHDVSGKPTRLVGGITDITDRRRAEEALENSRRQLRALSARIQNLREEERAGISREIHDELGQVLTAIKINIDWLEQKIEQRE